jgi:beta-glucosidase
VVQLYVRGLRSPFERPDKELRAFAKVELAAGEEKTVRFELAPRAFALWDTDSGKWKTQPGEREIVVGASSRDLRARAALRLLAPG